MGKASRLNGIDKIDTNAEGGRASRLSGMTEKEKDSIMPYFENRSEHVGSTGTMS